MKDKLNLIKNQITKTFNREFENFQKNFSNFKSIRMSMIKKTEIEEDADSDRLLNEIGDQKRFKVDDGQIKYLHDVSEFRKNKMENIYTKTLYVKKITDDINHITKKQEVQIEKIADNVEPVVYNAKDTFVSLLQASAEDKNFKSNNCFITMIISFGLFFLLLVMINWNR
jgi:hypothetical protein